VFKFFWSTVCLRLYYRLKLSLWAFFNLPKFVFIADSSIEIPARNWMFAIPARIDSTRFLERDDKGIEFWYEPDDYEFFIQLVKDKKVFFDVGANIGWYSYLAAAHGVSQIVAFEFIADYSNFLKNSFSANDIKGIVVNQGVGENCLDATYSDPLASASGRLGTLDDYAMSHNIWPDFVKMDIEGFELDALRGARQVLSRRPVLHISIHSEYLAERGQSSSEVLGLLYSFGYTLIANHEDTYFMR